MVNVGLTLTVGRFSHLRLPPPSATNTHIWRDGQCSKTKYCIPGREIDSGACDLDGCGDPRGARKLDDGASELDSGSRGAHELVVLVNLTVVLVNSWCL